MNWHDRAACRDHPEIDWFPSMDQPGGQTRAHRANVNAAKAICATCPVRTDCLTEGLALYYSAGIWGGHTEAERKGMPKPRLRRSVAECGTDAGYYHHRRYLFDDPCESCKRAHADATSRRKVGAA